MNELKLKYGCNPHQVPSRIYVESGALPIEVLNGRPGYINLLDALNGWQLVRELRQAVGLPAAASFKHVSPAGAAVGRPLSNELRKALSVPDLELSPLAAAYARARGADRMSSFGDWAALSDTVDEATARLLQREVSDGVIAPAFEEKALEILRAKKGGDYRIVRIDPDFEPPELESRDVFGITFEQKRNDAKVTINSLNEAVTALKEIPDKVKTNMVIALITLKYTQSNSVCLAYDGQVIGIGAGQQSRVHCTRLAASKADIWYLRQHPAVMDLPFKEGISRPTKDNAIDQYLLDRPLGKQALAWQEVYTELPAQLSSQEKQAWLSGLKGATLGSDAFIPFRDTIDRAAQSGVGYVVQPGGSLRDSDVIEACDEHRMTMVFTGTRLFHH